MNIDPEAKPTRRVRWWHIAIAAVAALAFLTLPGGTPDLRVLQRSNGEINIHNVGRKAIEVNGVRVNDNAACRVVTMLNLGNPDADPWPIRLEVGAGIGLIPFCRAVRIRVQTDAGSATFEFSR